MVPLHASISNKSAQLDMTIKWWFLMAEKGERGAVGRLASFKQGS